jgi:hypothetical protein
VLVRCAAIGLLLVAIVPLSIAWQLSPEEQGWGTHRQLGLPPCSVRLLWGIRCPMCGMTTSWAYAVRGQFAAAAAANAGGLLLAAFTVACLVPVVQMLGRGQLPDGRVLRGHNVALLVIASVVLIEWLVRLGASWAEAAGPVW